MTGKRPPKRGNPKMRCPKCQADFETFRYEGVDLDRCTGCQGIWFDATEQAQVAETGRAEHIDVGSRRSGRKYNELHNIDCPRCTARMMTVVDSVQTHIEYETCPDCYGSFFDAGELKDLGRLSVTERLKRILEISLAVR